MFLTKDNIMKSIKAPEGGVYRQEFYKCNKERCKKCKYGKGHGPYWSRYWWEDGKTRKEYIGKNLPLTKDNGEGVENEDQPLTKDRSLPKTLTKDKPPLPKTRRKALPKTDKGVVKRAIKTIQDFHSKGIEPPVSVIAEAVGMESRPLGRLMKAEGLEAKNVRRDGKRARRYTFDLMENRSTI